ncbi:hypothetical protein, partial [Salmonella sp. s58953]|uniref:hypothetical protein n=1 Tax=Salmonella sp. s58953 TaxID=3159711 RepID=UPI00397F62C8
AVNVGLRTRHGAVRLQRAHVIAVYVVLLLLLLLLGLLLLLLLRLLLGNRCYSGCCCAAGHENELGSPERAVHSQVHLSLTS